jgi:uncharacterized RDD family membrane protein YckC
MTATPASLWLRLAAAIYDFFPLLALWMLTAGLALLAVHGGVDLAHPTLGWQLGLRAALLAVSAAYFVISWVRGGQTIGMRPWRLRVIDIGGGNVPWPRALLRFGVAIVSLAALGVGFLWCLFSRDKATWHDLATSTRVVRLARD